MIRRKQAGPVGLSRNSEYDRLSFSSIALLKAAHYFASMFSFTAARIVPRATLPGLCTVFYLPLHRLLSLISSAWPPGGRRKKMARKGAS